MFRINFQCNSVWSSLKSICKKEIVICIRTLFAIQWAVSWKCFILHQFRLPEIWFVALILETIQFSGNTEFIRKCHINVLLKQFYVVECIFKTFCVCESCSKSQARYMLEKMLKISWTLFLYLLLYVIKYLCIFTLSYFILIYVSKCSFIWNTRSDTAGEKDFDATIQIALEHALVQRFKKIEIDRKTFFNKNI